MILTLPISHVINRDNVNTIPNVKKYQIRNLNRFRRDDFSISRENNFGLLFHDSIGIVSYDFREFIIRNSVLLRGLEFEVISFHLGYAYDKLIKDSLPRFYPANDAVGFSRRAFKDIARNNIEFLRNNGPDIKIALENSNYYNTPVYDYICEPEFIREIIEENDIYFTFDLAHAAISAWNMNIPFINYVEALPMERCIEVHISQFIYNNTEAIDKHWFPSKLYCRMWYSIIRDLIPEDVYLILEYYGDIEQIKLFYSNAEEWLTYDIPNSLCRS